MDPISNILASDLIVVMITAGPYTTMRAFITHKEAMIYAGTFSDKTGFSAMVLIGARVPAENLNHIHN